MALVPVSRQTVDANNQIQWVVVEVDETELLEEEVPFDSLEGLYNIV